MLSSYTGSPEVSAAPQLPEDRCSTVNDRVVGFAVCSLSAAPHSRHLLLCEDTGDLMGEWTQADPTFRAPSDESTTLFNERDFGDAA